MSKLKTILDQGLLRNASDIHLLVGSYPALRVSKELVFLTNLGKITADEQRMIVRELAEGNEEILNLLDRDKILDLNYKYDAQRFRVNISYAMDVPVCTLRIIKEQLPKYESLNLPEIVRELTLKNQGLILVTGKPGAGKTTTLSALVN